MGRISHHAIVVTCAICADVKPIRRMALKIFRGLCPVTAAHVSKLGYASFAILPDGSKEGWEHSNACDQAREEFKRLWGIEVNNTGRDGPYGSFVEVLFADDNDQDRLIESSNLNAAYARQQNKRAVANIPQT